MKVRRHRLHQDDDTPYPFVLSPNRGAVAPGRPSKITHEYLTIHYTGTETREAAIRTLTTRKPRDNVSAHIVVDTDGGLTQLVAMDTVAWHAGRSRWANRRGLNEYSIGIEIVNPGYLTRRGDKWYTWYRSEIDDDQVAIAVHKNEDFERGWHIYTAAQIEVVYELSTVLVAHYGLRGILGHDDISPGRKQDPGPLFPLERLQNAVMGRGSDEDEIYETLDISGEGLNIRSGPGASYAQIEGSPLPRGTRVSVITTRASWWQVEVLDVVRGFNDLEGWVSSRYLRRLD